MDTDFCGPSLPPRFTQSVQSNHGSKYSDLQSDHSDPQSEHPEQPKRVCSFRAKKHSDKKKHKFPKETMPRSSTTVLGLDDKKGQQELRPRGPSAMLPLNPCFKSPVPDQNAWDIHALNINWSGLTAYAYPPTALLHRVIQKIRQSSCLIIVIAPGWPGMPWFWDLVQLSTEIPLQLPVSRTLLKQSHNYVFHSNPQHLNLHALCLGVDSSKNKASLWRWQRELLPLRGHQQGPSTSQSGPYVRDGAEKIRWISPLPV